MLFGKLSAWLEVAEVGLDTHGFPWPPDYVRVPDHVNREPDFSNQIEVTAHGDIDTPTNKLIFGLRRPQQVTELTDNIWGVAAWICTGTA